MKLVDQNPTVSHFTMLRGKHWRGYHLLHSLWDDPVQLQLILIALGKYIDSREDLPAITRIEVHEHCALIVHGGGTKVFTYADAALQEGDLTPLSPEREAEFKEKFQAMVAQIKELKQQFGVE